MKKKIFSLGMIIVLVLSSMLLSATPASAGTLTWSTQGFTGLNQVVAGSSVDIVRVAPNGDVFVVDTVSLKIYKSVDGGRTYAAPAATIPGPPVSIADLQISPNYTTDGTVVVLANMAAGPAAPQVFISTNGGTVFGALGAPLPAAETGTSVAISPDYVGGFGGIIAGTTNGFAGDVYQYTMAGWAALGIPAGEDVLKCAFSPNYPIDATIVAVTADAGPNTYVRTKVATGGWDVNIGATPALADGAGNPFSATAADMAFPSDFNGSLAFNRTVYVSAISGSGADKIYRVNIGVGPTAVDFNTFNNVGGATGDDAAASIAYSGTQTAGTLYAGNAATAQVYRSSNAYPTAPAVLISFVGAAPAPSGTGGMTKVALAADYASSNKVLAGTTGLNSALNVSNNGGAAFYQAGLINTTVSNIQDVQAISASEIFVVTADTAAVGNPESIWKTEDGGLVWYRIATFGPLVAPNPRAGDTTADQVIIRPSPDYATDHTLYLADVGGVDMMLSNNGGDTWTPRTAPNPVADIAVKDMYTIYVGCGTSVYSSFNGGFFFSLPSAVPAAVIDIELDLASGHILVGDANGGVSISTGGPYSAVGVGLPFGLGETIIVAFDANYGDNHYIYAADTSGATAGIWRHAYVAGPPAAWSANSIDGGACAAPADLMVAPDGTLYASDATAAAADNPATALVDETAGGLVRILDPAAFPAPTMVEQITSNLGDNLPANDTLTGLAMAEGSNIIWAINNLAVPNIRTYTDTMSTASPAQVSPADGQVFSGATSATFVFEAVAGATSYTVRYSTRTDFLPTATTNLNVNFPLSATGTGANALIAGMTYYWQVQVTAPVFGPWSQTWSFQTQLAPGPVNAPGILSPSAGGTGPGGYNASLTPTFQWGTVPGATGYEFELATDAGLSNVIVSEILTATAYEATTALDYSTTYYWRVRGVSATSETAWSPVTAFTTMDKPTAPPEGGGTTVIVPTQQPPEIVIPTQPAPQITIETGGEEGVAPGYIWAVIIIGAVLVIALIVLIVRTRRTV